MARSGTRPGKAKDTESRKARLARALKENIRKRKARPGPEDSKDDGTETGAGAQGGTKRR